MTEDYGLDLRAATDLFEVDYYELADRSVGEVRELLAIPPKSSVAIDSGSVGPFARVAAAPVRDETT